MRRFLLILVVLAGASIAACHWLLPERFAVNAPIAHLLFQRGVDAPSLETVTERLRVPAGFSIGRFHTGLPNARFLRLTGAGDLLVSVPRTGSIHLLERDAEAVFHADEAIRHVGGRLPHHRSPWLRTLVVRPDGRLDGAGRCQRRGAAAHLSSRGSRREGRGPRHRTPDAAP